MNNESCRQVGSAEIVALLKASQESLFCWVDVVKSIDSTHNGSSTTMDHLSLFGQRMLEMAYALRGVMGDGFDRDFRSRIGVDNGMQMQ